MKEIIFILISITLIFLIPSNVLAAQILQVRDSTTLIIGDQNRNYTVRIACINVEKSKEKEAKKYVDLLLPRYSKVNLRPKGSKDGVLISRVIRIDSDDDIGDQIISAGLGSSNC